MQQAKKEKFLERMAMEKERLEKVQREREMQLYEKRRLQSELEAEKEQILRDFELKKKRLKQGQMSARNPSFYASVRRVS